MVKTLWHIEFIKLKFGSNPTKIKHLNTKVQPSGWGWNCLIKISALFFVENQTSDIGTPKREPAL